MCQEQLSDQTTQPEAARKAARKEAGGDAESTPKGITRPAAAAADLGNPPLVKASAAQKKVRNLPHISKPATVLWPIM